MADMKGLDSTAERGDERDPDIKKNPHISLLGKRPSIINDAEYRYRVDTTFPEYTPRFIKVPTVIVMVGLPARGKTYISKKLGRYLNWIGISTKVVNVGMYRRKIVGPDMKHDFFKPDNEEAQTIRRECAIEALVDGCRWLESGGQAVIYDATNTTRERRKMILDYCGVKGLKVFFVESICEDPAIVNANVKEVKLFGPDYCDTDKDVAVTDFLTRIEHYKAVYETLSYEEEGDLSFLKIINVGQQYFINMVHGYLQGRVVFYLMNIHVMKRSIYLTRHGESLFNIQQRIGGDPGLSTRGSEYSRELAKYMESQNIPNLKVWTSQMQATIKTSQHIPATVEQWKALNELCAGNCDGMTYEEIKEKYPEEYDARIKDKFNYRYPRGESYKDLIARLEPVILELERQKNVLVICHQAVIRCLLAYFLDHSPEEVPHLRVPLHTVFKLTPIAFGCRVEKIPFNVDAVDTHLSIPQEKRARSVSPIPEEPMTLLNSEQPGPSHL